MALVEKTVFISYRRADVSWALAVYQYLAGQKYDVFFDYTSLPETDFEQIIISNIRARAHFLLILTPTTLDRINEPGDWLRLEIETAIDEKRNIIPLFFDDFSFGSPNIKEKLTGKIAKISRYNGLSIPAGYFPQAMERLQSRYLNVPLDAVLHPVSNEVRKKVNEEKQAANRALREEESITSNTRAGEAKTNSSIRDFSASPAPDIFISYLYNEIKERDFAVKLAEELKSSGLSVWIDVLDIQTGARWDDAVNKALDDCKIYLVILSPASVSSDNVKDEIDWIIDKGKRILPVLFEQTTIPFRLRRFQYVDLTNKDFNEAIEIIRYLLSQLLEESQPLTESPTQTVEEEFNDYKQYSDESEQILDDAPEPTPEQLAEREARLQAAIEANRLSNNRSQAVFNDRAQGEDQLGIKDEVDALAETLLLRDVEPPVAVGVMGGWGSGKSFVMYLINQFVQATRAKPVKLGWADGDEKDPKIPAFVGHIYQVNFNAWTYAKSNLWASLMDTIFTTLNRQMQLERLLAYRNFSFTDEPPEPDQIRDSLLAGGDELKKIYQENIQLDQDDDLKDWRENLVYWSQHLLKETLLWNVIRGQQVQTLEKLKDTEEQLNQLKARREQFGKDRSLKEITSEDLDEKTARIAYVQSLKSFILAFLSDRLSKTVKDELQKQDISDEDVQKYFKEAKGLLGGVKSLWRYLLWIIIFSALTFAVPYLWDKYALEIVQFRVAQIISALIALAPTLAVVLPWIKKSVEAGTEAKKILEGAYTAQLAKTAEKIVNATDETLSNKKSELQGEIAKGSVAAYDALINLLETQAEEQRQKIGPSAKYSNLMEFVQSRLDAATYENQLGLMHQVRRDIDELTFSLVDNASEDAFPRGKPRVILYIDDLDRCPPPRVVEILEAVQLLLNTKLFIVILGLDTRYVTRSLEKEYKEILQHEGDPSGLDYIEKIIQIPYRVRSIEPDGLRNYIEKQMDIEKAPEPLKAEPLPASQDEEQGAPPTSDQLTTAQTDLEHPEAKGISPTPDELPIPVPPPTEDSNEPEPESEELPAPEPEPIELPAAIVQFKQEDLEDLAACCQKVILTPRSIKRLVNVFKLMKIFWFRADINAGLEERDRPRNVKQAAICLLALSSAYPEVMREVFVQLESKYRQNQIDIDLFDALNKITLPKGSARELSSQYIKYTNDLAALKTINGNGQDKFGQLTLREMMLSTFNIVRSFSFVGDPVYWIDDDEDATPLTSVNEKKKASSKD